MRDLPDAQYGEAQTFRDLQQGAPLAQVPSANVPAPRPGQASGPATPSQNPLASIIPAGAPTMRPAEPVTAGAALGPGPGTEALGPAATMQSANYTSAKQTLTQLAQTSSNPDLKVLAATIQRSA